MSVARKQSAAELPPDWEDKYRRLKEAFDNLKNEYNEKEKQHLL
jgi:hypothetical protein